MKSFIVIGGAGNMGRIIVRDLVEFSDPSYKIVIADHDLESASNLARKFERRRPVTAKFLDIKDSNTLSSSLSGSTVVINSTPFQFNLNVMKAALDSGSHYVDLGGLFHMTRKQLRLNQEFKRKRLTALLGIGAAPGITNLLSAFAADRLETIQAIHTRVASVDETKYLRSPALPISYSLQTILDEFSMNPVVFHKGKFTYVEPMSGNSIYRFPKPIGKCRPMHTLHSEIATLPHSFRRKGVREVTFKIAFDAKFLDRVQFLRDLGFANRNLLRVNGGEVRPIEVANRVAMTQKPARAKGKIRQTEIVRAIVKGTSQGGKVTWFADCITQGFPEWNVGTDINTGAPPSIAAQLIAQGEVPVFGVVPPEQALSPERVFEELKKRKLWFRFRKCSGWNYPV